MKTILLCAIALLLTLSGCADVKPPQSHYYLLSAPSTTSAPLTSPPLSIRVLLPQFLSQGTLIVQLDQQQIRRSHYHRWAEPLPGLIERFLQRRLQQRLSPAASNAALTITIDRFHGSAQGDVWLSGQWWQNNAATEPHVFNYQSQQQQPGYAGLVVSLQQLLDEASAELAEQLSAGD